MEERERLYLERESVFDERGGVERQAKRKLSNCRFVVPVPRHHGLSREPPSPAAWWTIVQGWEMPRRLNFVWGRS